MVHSGSRGIGPVIRDHHLRLAQQARSGLRFLDAESAEGQDYLNDMQWAVAYADANRQALIDAASAIVRQILGGSPLADSVIFCHHNHVVSEEIGDRRLWLHRKGAISAKDGEPGIIPGSMGSPSYHVKGRGCEAALVSSSHGAGRTMSRFEARRTISVPALMTQMNRVWFDQRRAERLIDEAPSAYKDITKVMKAQRTLTKVVRKLTPILSYKGI
jgi:tRNA-splicing ligase RtcB